MNDPVGAMAAVLAFEVVVVLQTATSLGGAVQDLATGFTVATLLGIAGGWGIARAFRMAYVPESMKVPVLFVVLLCVFALSDTVLHEAGLLAVTIMGIWIARSELPSYVELRRFKEHATVLLVSGVFILLAANTSWESLSSLDMTALLFVLVVILVARPLPVLAALAFSDVPWRERLLVAFTGPRGVVLVAVAGLFGERLVEIGVSDAERIAPLAFALVAATVVLHGFALTPMARLLKLTAARKPGVIILGGSPWTVALAEALKSLDIEVIITDPNHAYLHSAREAGVDTFYGDVLSKAAEERLDLVAYETLICATDNDAYNTLVATDLAPEFGRENVFQFKRVRQSSDRFALPATLGGQNIGNGETYFAANERIASGWEFRATRLSEEFTLETWREKNPDAIPIADLDKSGTLRFLGPETDPKDSADVQLLSLMPPKASQQEG